MAAPDWEKILTIPYRKGDPIEIPLPDEELGEDHILVEQTGLEPERVEDQIDFLSRMDLIAMIWVEAEDETVEEQDGGQGYSHRILKLEEAGFKVAHEREQGLREEGASSAVALLTGVLSLVALIQASVAFTSVSGRLQTILVGLMIVGATGLFIGSWYQLFKAGILDLGSLSERRARFEK